MIQYKHSCLKTRIHPEKSALGVTSSWNYHRMYSHKLAVTPRNTQILVIVIIRAIVPSTETLLCGRSMFDIHSLNSSIENYISLKNEVAYLFCLENLTMVPRISLRQIVRWIPLDFVIPSQLKTSRSFLGMEKAQCSPWCMVEGRREPSLHIS